MAMTAHKNKVWVVIVSCVDCGQSVNLSFVLISQIINKLWDPNMIFQAEIIGEKNCELLVKRIAIPPLTLEQQPNKVL